MQDVRKVIRFMADEKKTYLRTIQDGIAVLKAAGDATIKDQAEKIEEAVKGLVEKTQPAVESYANELKAFDESFATKYGYTFLRVVEFVMLAAIFFKVVL